MIANNPAEIILALDRELDHEVPLVLYGRAALSLGFDQAPTEFHATQDVDAIISLSQLPALTSDESFWDALDRTNLSLSSKGLHIRNRSCFRVRKNSSGYPGTPRRLPTRPSHRQIHHCRSPPRQPDI